MRVCEYEGRQLKIDSVLGKVGSILVRVPFELHRLIQVYIRKLRDASSGATLEAGR